MNVGNSTCDSTGVRGGKKDIQMDDGNSSRNLIHVQEKMNVHMDDESSSDDSTDNEEKMLNEHAEGRTTNKAVDLEISPVQNNDDADRIIGRIFRTLEVQITELMVKVKQKRSHIATDNRDVAAPALSPLGVEINLIPPEEQDKMECKKMTIPVPEEPKEEQSE